MKALIIEDEPHAQTEIKRIIKKVNPDIKILAMIGTVEDGISWLQNNDEPDLIFSDIQLSDGLSFSIFEKVKVNAPIIFTTAFDEYAIKAFELNSIDYLLKPIDPKALKKTLDKLEAINERHSSKSQNGGINDELLSQLLKGKESYKSRFLIKQGDIIRYISVDQVAYFTSSSEITFLHTHERKKYALEYTLDELVKLLDPAMFYRVNRKYIASINSVQEVHKYFNSRLKVILKPDPQDDILVSRARAKEFLQWMEK